MIENLRKYTGLIIVLFVLVIIGFIFLDTSSIRAARGGVPVLKIDGREYTGDELRKLGDAGYDLTQSLWQSGDFQIFNFLISLRGDAQSQEEATENFFINRMLLRSSQKEFGIYPSEEEIDTFIRQLSAFTGPDGAFSQEQYRNFIERGIGRLGLTEVDIRVLASDIITHRKLSEILGSGLTTDSDIVAKRVAIDNQRINTQIARIDIAPIEEKIDPSEEEIKTYWETVRDAFKTAEQRKFTYLIAKPIQPEEPRKLVPLAADADEEAKAEYEKKKAERDAEIAEAKRLARLDNNRKVDEFIYRLESQEEVDFKKLAEEDGFQVMTSELFARNSVPTELQASLRGASSKGTADDALFEMSVSSDPKSRITHLAVGKNDWLIAHVDEVKDSQIKTYEEARAEARAQLITNQATAALTKAAEEAREKIQTAINEGKPFAEGATAAGITSEIITLPEVTQSFQVDASKAPTNLFDATKYTDPGNLADPVIESDRAFLILVEKREILKNENSQTMIETEIERAESANQINAFNSWLNMKTEAADVQRLNRS